LVCTVHDESGLANFKNLHAILEKIQPEVIFLEVPTEAFERFYISRAQNNLESRAVIEYSKNHSVELIPIDLPTPDQSFFTKNRYLFERIEGNSSEYRRLMDWYINYVRDYGFAYLNSDHYSKNLSELKDVILDTIQKIGDPKITELYELWNKTNELRDIEMMEKIHKYSCGSSFEKAVFLIGAAHRPSIIEKAQQHASRKPGYVKWDFYLQRMLIHNEL